LLIAPYSISTLVKTAPTTSSSVLTLGGVRPCSSLLD